MSIALVVTRGFGNGTFSGTIADVVTRGYTIGDEVIVERNTGGWLSPEQVRRLRQIAEDNGRDRTNESRRRRQRREKRLRELEEIFNQVQGIIPGPAVEAVAEAVRPFSASSDTQLPPVEAIDFTALLQSVEAVQALTNALLEASTLRQEEGDLLLLMVSA